MVIGLFQTDQHSRAVNKSFCRQSQWMVVLPGHRAAGWPPLVWLLAANMFLIQWFAKSSNSQIKWYWHVPWSPWWASCLWASFHRQAGGVKTTHSGGWLPVSGELQFSGPVAARWEYCQLQGQCCLSAEEWPGNMVLFLYSGSEKGSSVTETPVIKKHNGLHLTLPDAHDTDSGEETRFVLSHPKCFCERGMFCFLWQGWEAVCMHVAGLVVRSSRSVSRAISAAQCDTVVWLYLAFPCRKQWLIPASFYKALWDEHERY